MEAPKDIPDQYKVGENFRCQKVPLSIVFDIGISFAFGIGIALGIGIPFGVVSKNIYSIDSLVSWPVVYHRKLHLQYSDTS